MPMQLNHINEQEAARAFSQQSAVFDAIYAGNTIVHYKRKRVREHLLPLLQRGSHILELNAGTGDDAVFLAQHGHFVHATDIAAGMQEKLVQKIVQMGLTDRVSQELCSYTALGALQNAGPYDCIFSNFAGLNCTAELKTVLDSFDGLLKPGGTVVLTIMPPFCLWESALMLKGKFKTATRRIMGSKGAPAKIDGAAFTCWYYWPGVITSHLKNNFQLLSLEGLCTFVPPSYIEHFAERYPRLYTVLCSMEEKWKTAWPWKYMGDYYIISLRKNS